MDLSDLRLVHDVSTEDHVEAVELLSRPSLADRVILAASICPNLTMAGVNGGVVVRAIFVGEDNATSVTETAGRSLLLASPARARVGVRCEAVSLANNPLMIPLISCDGLDNLIDRVARVRLKVSGECMAAQAWHRLASTQLVQALAMSQSRALNPAMMATAFEAVLARCVVESLRDAHDPTFWLAAGRFFDLRRPGMSKGEVWYAVAGQHGRDCKLIPDDGRNWSLAQQELMDGLNALCPTVDRHKLPEEGHQWVHGVGQVPLGQVGRRALCEALRQRSQNPGPPADLVAA